jgi:hypothetical protein
VHANKKKIPIEDWHTYFSIPIAVIIPIVFLNPRQTINQRMKHLLTRKPNKK